MLDLYVHHSPNALIIGFYETKVDPENPSLFEYLPDDLLVLILKDLRPVDAAKLFTTFKYPKARLKKPLIKRFYEQKVYLSLFQEAWLRKTLEAQRIISFCILLDDPLITLLTRSMSHALTHVQAGRIGYFVRSLELSDNLIWTSAPNTEAILEDAVWDENGSIYLMIKYLNANIPMRAELEFMHALQGNNPYARALMCFGHLNGVFGLTKSPLLATFYIAGADQKTLETLAKEHAKVPYR